MKFTSLAATALLLSGCATTSDVMDVGGGNYMISSHASAFRGGATGANSIAYQDANRFCAKIAAHAVVTDARERDVYQSSMGGSWNGSGGSFGGARVAAGNVNLRFRCSR